VGKVVNVAGKVVNVAGKIATVGYDVVRVGGEVGKGGLKSIVPALAVLAVTNGSLPIAGIYLGFSTIVKTLLSFLRDTRMSSIPFIRNFQKLGVGQYYDIKGVLKYDHFNITGLDKSFMRLAAEELADGKITQLQFQEKLALGFDDLEKLRAQGSLMSKFYSGLSKFEAFSTWGVIGAGVGSLLAPFLGISATLGAVGVGLASGAAGLGVRTVMDNLSNGKQALVALENSNLMKFPLSKAIAQIPFMSLVDAYMTNMWWGQQIDLIKNKYHGNFGAYWKDNWNVFENPSFLKTANGVFNVWTVGSSILGITNPLIVNAMAKAIIPLMQVLQRLSPSMLSRALAATLGPGAASGITAGGMVGTAAGIAVAILLGVPLGPAMLLGATIGGIVGTGVGIGISIAVGGLSFGAGLALTAGITAVTSAVGAFIGSLFDKSLGLSGALFTNFLQGIMAIFQMLSLLKQKISFDSSFGIALGLVSLLSMLYKMGVLDTSNQCVEQGKCPSTPAPTAISDPQIINLSAYDVTLIQKNNIVTSADTLNNITQYLEENLTNLKNTFPDKNIYLNLASSDSFNSEQFVIIGIDQKGTETYENIQKQINTAINDLKNTTTYLADNLKEPVFLNVQN
jgi:hypothetical protein